MTDRTHDDPPAPDDRTRDITLPPLPDRAPPALPKAWAGLASPSPLDSPTTAVAGPVAPPRTGTSSRSRRSTRPSRRQRRLARSRTDEIAAAAAARGAGADPGLQLARDAAPADRARAGGPQPPPLAVGGADPAADPGDPGFGGRLADPAAGQLSAPRPEARPPRAQLPWTGQPPTASRMEPLAVSDSTAKHDPARLDKVVNLCKRRGFVFPSGEIYGGTRSAWDYGPLGVELKENIKKQWWRTVVQSRDDIVGLDSSVILPRQTWVASGPRRRLHRPADRVPELPQAVPGRPPRGGLRGEEGPARRRTAWPTSPARTAAPRARGPSRATST